MLNVIWLLLLGGGIIYAALNGNIEAVTSAAFTAATESVRMAIELCGVLCLWLGLLKLAEEAGLVRIIARLISPLVRRLFPDVPPNHPALFAIIMNIAANLLGLGNAATPFGLKAMEHLQSLNPDKSSASPAMITLLALNTSCITLVPTLVISLRTQAGSALPTDIVPATIIATSIGTCFAILFDRCLRRKYFGGKGGRLL